MTDQYQHQLDALTNAVEDLSKQVPNLGKVSEQLEWLLARVELLNAILVPLLANAEPTVKGMAIASAQVKLEMLQEQGHATIAEKYARHLAGIVAS